MHAPVSEAGPGDSKPISCGLLGDLLTLYGSGRGVSLDIYRSRYQSDQAEQQGSDSKVGSLSAAQV